MKLETGKDMVIVTLENGSVFRICDRGDSITVGRDDGGILAITPERGRLDEANRYVVLFNQD